MKLRSLITTFILAFAVTGVVHAEEVSPETVPGATTIDGARAKQMFDNGALFVDTRSNNDWEAGRIPGAVHLELKTVYNEESLMAETDTGKDEILVMYCNGTKCMRSSKATAKAVDWGFKNVYYYRLGFPDWKSRGYPTE